MLEPYFQRDGVTLYHGESLGVLSALDVRVQMVLTDPPYSSGGMFRGDRTASTTAKYVSTGTLDARPEYSGDNRDQRGYLAWCSLWLLACYRLAAPGALAAVFTDWRQLPTTTDALQCAGWGWRGIFAWDKTAGSRPRLGGYRAQCEFVPWATAGPAPNVGVAGAGLCTAPTIRGDRRHQAEKPESVITALAAVCPPGGTLLDPFAGSGTSLVVAQRLGLKAIGIEIEERYCEVAAKRLAQHQLPFTEPQGTP